MINGHKIAIQLLREDGYAVVVFSPERLGRMSREDMESFLMKMGNEAIDELPNEGDDS
ncbi:hypothetical protein N0609_12065 [Pseudomonas aeruginosa]|jgi:predicted nicotinamide N-methyase|uniref:hypothetical protein n=1 Tax=unclassified Pseudomonas TaxID=196821 RepID=UPI0013E1A393|nr:MULTISPECIES: hypothetical protein [unclassified Pseudomonas]MCS7527041.1 hypothetical protein [Pseudomonas aeruginosa]MCS8510271.1 hypothetical protein [Pseudomonas aeruginosa]MCS8541221.1 hypothetical protein [Pseudomonas aeruginosa]MCT0600367.1 hypothetical protein [Pseudomonas aeruginosa]QIH07392.1 hypothetical protein ATY02_11985 [Pseudomonas sp. BIOMIG1BAC]